MKKLLFLLGHDFKYRASAKACVQHILSNGDSRKSISGSVCIKVLTVTPDLKQVFDTHGESDWLDPEKAVALFEKENPKENIATGLSEPVGLGDLANVLHKVADSLPYVGVSLDVLFFMGGLESMNSQGFIPVAGAIKRLMEWHNGRTLIYKLGLELSPLGHQFVEFGRCLVVNSVDEAEFDMADWVGKVSVMDHIESKGRLFSGFYFKSDVWDSVLQQKLPAPRFVADSKTKRKSWTRNSYETVPEPPTVTPKAVCGRLLEILQEVDLRTFPFFLLDSWTLKLHLQQGHSTVLVKYIQDMQQTGLLARLRIYPDSAEVPECEAVSSINTVAWKETVMKNYQHIQEPGEEEVARNSEFLYFLLLPDVKVSSQPLSLTSVVAQVLLSPREVNRNIIGILEDHLRFQNSGVDTKNGQTQSNYENSGFDLLPVCQRNKFSLMLELLEKSNRYGCRKLQETVEREKNMEHREVDILKMASDLQEQIVSATFTDGELLKDHKAKSTWPKLQYNFTWIPEVSLDSSKFPEKMALLAKDSSRKTFQSYPSVDSLPASSPLAPADFDKKKNAFDFDVSDILRFFNEDGSCIKLPKSPVKLKGRSLCRVESQPDLKSPWPDSQLLQYHDIYYYTDESAMKLEQRYSKVRDKGYFQDTRSSFVSPIKKKPLPKPALSLSPVRRSPRKVTSSQHLMTRSRSESNDSSSTKRLSPLDNPFKQPAARPFSPRKRLSLNTLDSSQDSFQSSSRRKSPKHQPSPDFDRINPDFNKSNARSPKKGFSITQTSRVKVDLSKSPKRSLAAEKTFNLPHSSTTKRQKQSALNSSFSLDEIGKRSQSNSDLLQFKMSRWKCSPSALGAKVSSKKRFSSAEDSQSLGPANSQPSTSNVNTEQLSSTPNVTSSQGISERKQSSKMKRSDRHKMKLQVIIDTVLKEKGVKQGDTIHAACSRNLFNVSMVLLKTLTTSQNLGEEMKAVVNGQVSQIINLEKRRCGIKL